LRQETIYNDKTEDDGDRDPIEGNIAIRRELCKDAKNIIYKIADELSVFLWRNIDKMTKWMTDKIFNIPEIRKEMIETDVEKDYKNSFDTLIQVLARPTANLFLNRPRGPSRKNLLRIHETQLKILNVFTENGKGKPRGIVQFIANGKHGPFHFEGTFNDRFVVETKHFSNDCDESVKNFASNKPVEFASPDKIENLGKKTENKKISKKKSGLFSIKEKTSLYTINNQEDFKSTHSIEEQSEAFENPIEEQNSVDNFEKLEFSVTSSTLEKVCDEIEEDFNEFLNCMKKAVFYGSNVQFFYNQELDKYRRKFLELEDECNVWGTFVSK
jgi:hypothetical protein